MGNTLWTLAILPVILGIFQKSLRNYVKAVRSYYKLPSKGKYRIRTSPSTGVKVLIVINKFTLLNPLKRGTWNAENRGVWFEEYIDGILYPRRWSLSHWGDDEPNRGGLPRQATDDEIKDLINNGAIPEDQGRTHLLDALQFSDGFREDVPL